MKTATLDVGGMLSVLDYRGVEKQLGRIPGVQRATASIASSSVTVEYDETVTTVAALKDKINECGFHCTGQIMPRHVCGPGPGSPDALLKQVASKRVEPTGRVAHELHIPAGHAPAATPATPTSAMPMSHDMAHEMGHGAGMDMQGMVRDMRNRFWISLIFSIPIFLYSPMGMSFISLKPPFGMELNLFLFFLASAAIIYPAWPFVVAAVRALRNGILNMAVLVLLSVGTGYLFSIGATFFFEGQQFYEASAVLLDGRAVTRYLAQDASEPLVGGRLQRDRLSVGCGCVLSVPAESGDCRPCHVWELGSRCHQCPDVETHQASWHCTARQRSAIDTAAGAGDPITREIQNLEAEYKHLPEDEVDNVYRRQIACEAEDRDGWQGEKHVGSDHHARDQDPVTLVCLLADVGSEIDRECDPGDEIEHSN
jgi:copper chaperone CopZ